MIPGPGGYPGGYEEVVYQPPGGYPALFDVCAVAWDALYFAYDPGYGQTRVGGEMVLLNWRPVELEPCVVVKEGAFTLINA
jgi:hypothetical protein